MPATVLTAAAGTRMPGSFAACSMRAVAKNPGFRRLDAFTPFPVARIVAVAAPGGAVWHDLMLRCPGRVIVEVLRWAADFGGIALNYVEARDLLTSNGRVQGVAVGATAGRASAELTAPVVINAAVDIAKKYSTEDSGRFVNGILGAFLRERRDPSGELKV